MAIKSIRIKNVMAFGCQSQDARKNNMDGAFYMSFINGINAIIGENGTGKTSLLKMVYVATQESVEKRRESDSFHDYFAINARNSDFLNNPTQFSAVEVINDDGSVIYNLSDTVLTSSFAYAKQANSAIFIPTTEMLSHSKGFLALNEKYQMPFDKTQIDIIVNASLPEARRMPSYMRSILDKIGNVIDGKVIQKDDEFYVLKKDGRELRFSLEAEGLRKLGLLWKLIRNGLLEPGTILIWDEPEANLNPEAVLFGS